MFYQYVRTAALNQQQTQYVSVFTTELFAHYLHIRCLQMSVVKCRQFTVSCHEVLQRYRNYSLKTKQLQTFLVDVLLLKSVKLFSRKCYYKRLTEQSQKSLALSTELDTSELVELLQQSAVEHLTTYRQLQSQKFSSVATIVTTDFEALYAYKRGDYQRCLQLSTQNVHTLLSALCMINVLIFPEVIQLMDDDIVSLTALALIVNPECRADFRIVCRTNVQFFVVTQLTLSLYLMTQCQLKLHHSVTSLTQTLEYIELAQRIHSVYRTFDHLTLMLAKRKLKVYLVLSI